MTRGRSAPGYGWLLPLLLVVSPGFLISSALPVSACRAERAGSKSGTQRSTDAAASASPSTSPPEAATKAAATRAAASEETGTPSDDARIALPSPPKPPELRVGQEKANATRILSGYGFPGHESLTPLCGWRDFNPGGTSWVVDLFTSPVAKATLRQAFKKRLGNRGLNEDTWSMPATGSAERELSLKALEEVKRYRRCPTPPPADAKTLVVARRAR